MPRLSLTEKAIEKLPIPLAGPGGATRQTLYFDVEQPRLAVRVTSGGSRVFVVDAWSLGHTVRVKLGACTSIPLKEARKRALEVLSLITRGVNPNEQRRDLLARSVTLREAFEVYISTRRGAKQLSERSEYDYRLLMYGGFTPEGRLLPLPQRLTEGKRTMDGHLSPWCDLQLMAITRDMVATRHVKLVKSAGGAQANYAMRVFSAVYSFARARWRTKEAQVLPENPVRVLSETKAWARVNRRRSLIKVHQLPAWFKAVCALESADTRERAEVARDSLLFLILTGLRKNEALRLRWRDVDLIAKTFTIPETKNREPHTLPLSDFLVAMLNSRPKVGEYVFPGPGKRGYLVDPKKQQAHVIAESSVPFTLHDLRRTFITIAESLDIPAYALKRLLNHKISDSDVTSGYIISNVERLRAPMQRITDFILTAVGVTLRETAALPRVEEAAAGLRKQTPSVAC